MAIRAGDDFVLSEEQCAEADREFVQFYQRRLCWLALREFSHAVADADHTTLAFMDFSRATILPATSGPRPTSNIAPSSSSNARRPPRWARSKSTALTRRRGNQSRPGAHERNLRTGRARRSV